MVGAPDSQAGDEVVAYDPLVTVTIQGGGAFIYSLLGQARAVEAAESAGKLVPVAFAGASAGGLIAAFLWAGLDTKAIEKFLDDTLASHADALGPSKSSQPGRRERHRVRKLVRMCHAILELNNPSRAFGPRTAWLALRSLPFSILVDYIVGKLTAKPWRRRSVQKIAIGIVDEILTHNGLFEAGGLRDKLNAVFREQLRLELEDSRRLLFDAIRSRGGDLGKTETAASTRFQRMLGDIPDPASPEFRNFTPRFGDFDRARHRIVLGAYFDDAVETETLTSESFVERGSARSIRPTALMLSVTEIDSAEPKLIDSEQKAFAHIPVADAVLASIAFPFVFRPVHFALKQGAPDNAFLDGGIMLNFPIAMVAKSLRQLLYGHEPTSKHDIRDPIHNDLSDQTTASTARVPSEYATPYPFRWLAFRPMMHLGLTIDEASESLTDNSDGAKIPTPANQPSAIYSLLGILSGQVRRYYEDRAWRDLVLQGAERVLLSGMNETEILWLKDGACGSQTKPGGVLDFHKLNMSTRKNHIVQGQKIAEKKVVEKLEFRWPTCEKNNLIPREQTKRLFHELNDATLNAASLLNRFVGYENAEGFTVRATVLALHGRTLRPMTSTAIGPLSVEGRVPGLVADESLAPRSIPDDPLCIIDLKRPLYVEAALQRERSGTDWVCLFWRRAVLAVTEEGVCAPESHICRFFYSTC